MTILTIEALQERLQDSNKPEILKALDEGWEPSSLEEAIDWWWIIVTDDPNDHIKDVLTLTVAHTPLGVLLNKVLGFYECEAKEFLEDESAENIKRLGWEAEEEESENQRQFRRDMKKAGRKIRFYLGRFYYKGWAAAAKNNNEFQGILRVTDVPLQWDQLGKDGYIVYPVQN